MDPPPWLDELDLRADGPPWLSMGLRRVGEEAWLWPDGLRDAELGERRRLLAERPHEVLHLEEGTEGAGAEVLDLVRAWLGERGLPADATGAGPDRGGRDEHPLITAGRLVQEDLCVMVPRDGAGGGGHRLGAAILCFPSHWRLAAKAGRPTDEVHGPVPGYATDLSTRVDRYLARLRPGVVGVRRNWSVHDRPDLFAPDPPVAPRPAGPDGLWLRSERQALRALPGSGAVLFTIRVQQVPFAVLARRADVAAALAARLRAQPPELTAMNGLAPHLHLVLPWLDAVAGGAAEPGSGPGAPGAGA